MVVHGVAYEGLRGLGLRRREDLVAQVKAWDSMALTCGLQDAGRWDVVYASVVSIYGASRENQRRAYIRRFYSSIIETSNTT